ncbi:MAG: inorganic phosphate transporter [Nitratireductor sp.]|uniref:inorganic phosphate transporter n=1 Tax=Nitratireductor sp. TaxID=1872084 RepID=UPI0026022FBF|nr:inorganic phosphate transporter [Nitratireductor sp.]MCV0350499.1 inorganic phosphate transporter [Nitratireductor sp.]
MSESSNPRKQTLDKDLDKLVYVEEATTTVARGLVAPGLALLFLALTAIFAATYTFGEPRAVIIVAAAAIGAYMALNIGANDVANNVGPAVGAKAMTLGGALLIAAVFESAGALIAGGDVVSTISKGIIDPAAVGTPEAFVRAMMAALISSALWINLATWIGAPVSTTHSVVGGVMGAGIAAAGFSSVDWATMSQIAASWVISPVVGGVIAALFLAFIKTAIIYQDDKIAAARRWLPLLIAIMAGTFSAYLTLKGLKKVLPVTGGGAAIIGLAFFAVTWFLAHLFVHAQSEGLENRNQSLRSLFKVPLVISAALLSFAHGANDVANAVGPLAAIVFTVHESTVNTTVAIPLWVMVIGAVGISIGLVLFGPKLIRMVGEQITKLNPMRAFCVALSAAITVIIASGFGLPISSTHTAVGAIFGVGFFREWYTAHSKRRRAYLERKGVRLKADNGIQSSDDDDLEVEQQKTSREEVARRKLVRRAHVRTIVAAWVTTVPAAAILSAVIFLVLDLIA